MANEPFIDDGVTYARDLTADELKPGRASRPQKLRGNRTGFKSLDALGRDPRVEVIENEGRVSDGGDGLWLYTVDGFCNGDRGCHIVHEDTVGALKSAVSRIRPCDCRECAK